MKNVMSFALIVCIVAPAIPIAARDQSGGPIARAGANAASRLAADSAPFAVQADAAAGNALALKWGELASVIQGQHATVTLTDGRTVRGEVMAVRDDALVMDVAGGSVQRDGIIARSSVATIRLERSRGGWGRHLGTVIGVLSGVVVGGYVSAQAADSAGTGIPLFLGIASAITIAGYYAGRQLDQTTTTIRVVP